MWWGDDDCVCVCRWRWWWRAQAYSTVAGETQNPNTTKWYAALANVAISTPFMHTQRMQFDGFSCSVCLCWARATICHWKAREKKCHTAYITCCTSNKRSVFRVELGLLSLPLVSMVYYMRARVRRARNTRITQWMHNAVGISTNGQSWHWATAAATTKLWSPLIGHKGTSSIDETDAFEILTVRRESMNLRHYRYSKNCRIFNST